MSYFNFNLKLSFYSNGETCACCHIPSSLYFYKTYEFTPKRASIFSSKLKPDGREFYSIEVRDVTSGYKKEITFFEDGINTDIIFKGWDKWVYIPRKYRNNSIPTFCLPVKITKGNCCEYRVYSFPYEKHRYFGDIYGTYKLTSEAVAVLFGYVKFRNSMVDSERKTAELIKNIFSITYSRISENEYKSYLI